MNIDAFWEEIFSDEPTRVRKVWRMLGADESRSIFDFLLRVCADPERIDAQRAAATIAIEAVRNDPEAIPQGALDFAKQLAGEAGRMLKLRYADSATSVKRDGSLVTEADLEADRMLHEAIRARFPEHAILSEESGRVYAGDEWAWMLDPIDGTSNFAQGFPCWGVLLALLHFGQPVLGVMDFPEVGEHYHAVKGGGAFLNEQPIRPRVPAMNDAGEAQILSTHLFAICSRSVKTAVPKLPSKLRISGSTGYDLALLASGVVVGLLQRRVYAWDIAAGWLLVQEAGGAVLETTGISVFPLNALLDCGERRFAICGAGSAETLGYLKKII